MTTQADIDDIVRSYVDLLIIQYFNKPKARATIDLFVRELLAQGILFDIRDAYSVDTAVGVQLDVIGKYVGIDRFYTGQDLDGYFSLITYEEVDSPPPEKIGLADYSDFDSNIGSFLRYFDVLSSGLRLDDESFRFLIRMRIVQNHSDHSHFSIDESMFRFFGLSVIPDSIGNMEMFYFASSDVIEIARIAFEKQVFPRPMGVGIKYLIERSVPFFGFATYDTTPSPFITGFATYDDYGIKEGAFLRYADLIEPI